MQDYISSLFSMGKLEKNLKHKEKRTSRSESIKRKSLRSNVETQKVEATPAEVQDRAIAEILENLKQVKYDFEKKVMDPAREFSINPHSDFIQGGDKSNPHIRAISRVEDAIFQLEDILRTYAQDPIKEDLEEVGADAPLGNSDMSGEPSIVPSNEPQDLEIEESYNYYKKLHPDQEDTLQINGWTYANGEIWNDAGSCSITYNSELNQIEVKELVDPDGIEQELVATCTDVAELDSALTNFAELSEIAEEMKQAFAEYIASQGEANEAVGDLVNQTPAEIEAKAEEPVIIDDWEYLSQDPEFNDNATLLYDKGNVVVFLQKDKEENAMPYYVNAIDSSNQNIEHEFADIDTMCTWLEVNELPVPTEDAKIAFSGKQEIHEAEKKDKEKECKCKLPDGMKCAKDDPSISTLAREVEDPKVANVDEVKNKDKK